MAINNSENKEISHINGSYNTERMNRKQIFNKVIKIENNFNEKTDIIGEEG